MPQGKAHLTRETCFSLLSSVVNCRPWTLIRNWPKIVESTLKKQDAPSRALRKRFVDAKNNRSISEILYWVKSRRGLLHPRHIQKRDGSCVACLPRSGWRLRRGTAIFSWPFWIANLPKKLSKKFKTCGIVHGRRCFHVLVLTPPTINYY